MARTDGRSAAGRRRSTAAPSCPRDAVTMRLPSGLNARSILSSPRLARQSGSPIGRPVSASHSRAVLSPDAVTMRLPSGLNAALHTDALMACERLADRLAGRRRPTAAPSCPETR